MTVVEVLRAIVDHVEGGGTVRGTSPLLTAIKGALESPELGLANTVPAPAPPGSLAVAHAMSAADLERRRSTLGSSEIAAVCQQNPWSSPHNVWLGKVFGEEQVDNERTQLGNILEPTILAIYCDRYGARMVKGVYQIGPEPWMSATPDGRIEVLRGVVLTGQGVLPICEAKLVGLRSLFMWGPGNTDERESDEVPLHYLIQALWQIACTGAPFVDLSALLGTEFRTYRIHANPDLQAKIVARGRQFWESYVIPRIPPPVDASDGAREMLKRLYPKSGPERVPSDPHLEELVADLQIARKALEAATAQRQLAENLIKEQLKDASGAFGDGWNIRYGTQKDGKRPFVFTDKATGKAA